MGLLDGILDNLVHGAGSGSVPSSRNPLVHLALMVLQQNGGIQGLLARLQQGGLGSVGQSWVGTGANQPVDPDALTNILGHGQLGALAQSLGLAPHDAATGLAQVLPDVVDRMTPQGDVPVETSDLIAQALARLQRTSS